MDHIIAKPLKRLFSNSKEYAKKHFSDYYNTHAVEYSANRGDAIIMTEIKSIMRTPPKTGDSRKPVIKCNVLFDDNVKISSPEISDNDCNLNNCSVNIDEEIKNSVNLNNNTIEHVTVKLIESPEKEIVTILDVSHTEPDKPQLENTELNHSDKPKQQADIRKTTQHIKVKIVVPRNGAVNEANKNKIDVSNVCSDAEPPEKCTEQAGVVNETKPEINTQEVDSSEKCEANNTCIFEENQSYPLSPVLSTQKIIDQFPVVDELIDFHERKMLQLTGRCASERNPLMGTGALRSRMQNSQSTLDDSEIVSALVRNRFVVNMYESRTCRRNRNKPSRFGRIYRSLERTVGSDYSSNMLPEKKSVLNNTVPEITHVNEISPIKLTDQLVSLNVNSIENPFREFKKQSEVEETYNETNVSAEAVADSITNQPSPQKSESERVDENHVEGKETERAETEIEQTNDAEDEYEGSSDGISSADITSVLNEDFANSTASSHTITEKCPQIEEENTNQTLTPTKEQFENSQGTDASYDMEEFLQKALGDELCNDTSSLEATTETKQKTKSPAPKYIPAEDSICTSDASDLISKINTFQSNFYRSLTRKLQHMSNTFRAPASSKREMVADEELDSIFPNNEQVTELVRQAAVQYEAMKQICKALTVCRNTKEFSGSMEQVEGERLLLLTVTKRQAILDEIRRLDYTTEETNSSTETGTVTISDVTFPLKNDSTEQQSGKQNQKQWYVCIFACGPKVFASQPTLAKPDGSIRFSKDITFDDLPSDFTISVELYSLLQRRNSRNYSHESKFHINKSSKKTHCPTPKKFLHREKLAQKIPARYDTGIRTSSFKSCGSLKLRVSDLAKKSPWTLRKVPICSPLEGSVAMSLQSSVQIPVRHSGFLTIGTEVGGCIAWSRRWCVLDGHMFRYWNYPCDEDSFNPLHETDLKTCVNAEIDVVERSLCAKPRTLLVETTNEVEFVKKSLNQTHSIQRYLLSADNAADLQLWKTHLNTVISALRTWKTGFIF